VQVIVHPGGTEASPVVREVFTLDCDDLAPGARGPQPAGANRFRRAPGVLGAGRLLGIGALGRIRAGLTAAPDICHSGTVGGRWPAAACRGRDHRGPCTGPGYVVPPDRRARDRAAWAGAARAACLRSSRRRPAPGISGHRWGRRKPGGAWHCGIRGSSRAHCSASAQQHASGALCGRAAAHDPVSAGPRCPGPGGRAACPCQ